MKMKKILIVVMICSIVMSTFLISATTLWFHSMSAKANSNWLSGWNNRMRITIDSGDLESDLYSFPVLIHLSNSSGINHYDATSVFHEIGGDRKKIAVTVGETQETYVDVEYWNASEEEAYLWANVTVTASMDQTLYLYYDKTHADNKDYVDDSGVGNSANVWDSDFKLVTHMQDRSNTSHVRDSTSNNNNGTKKDTGEPAATENGKINGAQTFDGADDYIDCGSANSLDDLTAWTCEAWINLSGGGENNWGRIVEKNPKYFLLVDGAGMRLQGRIDASTSNAISYSASQSLSTGIWHYVAATYNDNGDRKIDLFIDGSPAEVQQQAASGASSRDADNNLYIGNNAAVTRTFDGTIDEIRVSNTNRSIAWIKTSYESSKDHLLCYGFYASISPAWLSPSDDLTCTGDGTAFSWFIDGEEIGYNSSILQCSNTSNFDLVWCNVTFPDGTSQLTGAVFVLEEAYQTDAQTAIGHSGRYDSALLAGRKYTSWAWNNLRDDNTHLIAEDLTDRVYNPEDTAADNLPYLIQAALWLGNNTQYNWYNQTIPDEIAYTLYNGTNLGGWYDIDTDTLDCKTITALVDTNAERVRDGLLPIIESYPRIENETYEDRMWKIIESIEERRSVSSDYGNLPSQYAEPNGNALQIAARYYHMTNNETRKRICYRLIHNITMAYVCEVLAGSSFSLPAYRWDFSSHSALDTVTKLTAHGDEILSGLAWALEVEAKENTNQVELSHLNVTIGNMLSNITSLCQNPTWKFFVNEVDSSSGTVTDASFEMTQYVTEGMALYLHLNNKTEIFNSLQDWREHAHTWDKIWNSTKAQDIADLIETTMNHYSRMDINETQRDYVWHRIKQIMDLQQSDGSWTTWKSDGNNLRSLILYSQFVSAGVHAKTWAASLSISGVESIDDSILFLQLESPKAWTGDIAFDSSDLSNFGLDKNYMRHNEMIDMFQVEPNAIYTLKNRGERTVLNCTGTTLINGTSFDLSSSESILVCKIFSSAEPEKPILLMIPNSVTSRGYCENFTIKINVSDAYNVGDFEFEIHYNATLLDFVGVTWDIWGSGSKIIDEDNGIVIGSTSGSPVNGTKTLATVNFHAACYHIWKDESQVPGWKNNLTGTIYLQWANLSYPNSPALRYERGGANEISVGPDVVYRFSPIQGDVNNDGMVDIMDLRTEAAYYNWSNATYDLNGDGIIDIFDLIVIATNYGFTYP